MSDWDITVVSAVAVGAWLFGALLMMTGSVVGLVLPDHSGVAMILLSWGIFTAAGAGTLTIKECTRKNRKVMAVVLAQAGGGDRSVARFPSR